MGSFSDSGYVRARLDEWVTAIKSLYYGIFGTNIDLSSDTMDGQLAGALAESFSNEDQKAEDIYKSFSPSEASGVALSTLVTLNGITRNGATYSTATLTLTGTDGTVIPAGSVVRTEDTDEPFETDSEATIASGTATVDATAQNSGAVIALAGTITVIDDNISGWESVTNASDADVGADEETDEELRIRRANSVSISAQGNVDAVYGALGEVDGVTSVVVKENRTDTTDGDGISAHSIAAILEGGAPADIAETIWQTMSAGCNTFGSTTETIQDSQGFDQDIKFSRPTDVDIYIATTVSVVGDTPENLADEIAAAIVDYFANDDATKLSIGDDVIYSAVYVPIMNVGGVSVTALTVDTTTPATGTSDITIDFDEFARFDSTRITVTVT
jgi:uncharacterized phage protein gp47/JayE